MDLAGGAARKISVYLKKNPHQVNDEDSKERRRHTLPQDCSTICAGGLNFSVRDGKR